MLPRGRLEAVKLLAVFVPLDGVQLLALEIVQAGQVCVHPPQHVLRDDDFVEYKRRQTWKGGEKLL